jgi:hypothetical protein
MRQVAPPADARISGFLQVRGASAMETTNRNRLLHQLEETRNTVQRQHLLKQLWRLDQQDARRDEAETETPRSGVPRREPGSEPCEPGRVTA